MSLTFANPAVFWFLLALPVFIVLKVLADARARRAVTRLASPRLLDALLVTEGRARAWVVFSLELLALAFFLTALARPRYGTVSEESPGTGRSLIIAIDTSKSMRAEDVRPNRIERAKLAAEDLVKRLRGDRIGLMPFAGTAHMYAPLTPDTDALVESIQALDTEWMPRGGSNLARAIDLAIETFEKADLSGRQAMVLFSDGEELEGEALAAARRARDAKLSIICVAVGTPQGELIPDGNFPGGYLRDTSGKPVQTRLHREVLVRIADLTGGLYLTFDGKGVSDSRIDEILGKLQRTDMKSKVIETAVDRYRWPLAAGLLSLTAAFVTGIVRRHRAAFPGTALTAAATMVLLLTTAPLSLHAQDLLPPPELKPGVGKLAAPEKPSLLKKPAAPQKPAADQPAAETPAAAKPVARRVEDPPKEGDPWKFYGEGDWKNSVFNFSRLANGVRNDREIDRLQMGRGVAAFKAATARAGEFDAGMLEQAIEAFGVVLASPDADVREKAHYNLGNAIFERSKAAELARAIAFAKAKSKKAKKKYAITLKYLDRLIRELENSLEHYQETLILNKDHADAKKNHDVVAELVKKLRDIRKEQAAMEGEGGGEGEDEGQGQGQGKGNGKGKGKGKGQGQGGGSGEGEEGEGEGDEEGDEGGEGDKERDGKGKGQEGEGAGGDESNEEFEGTAGADGDAEGDDAGEDGTESGEGSGDGPDLSAGDAARNSTIQTLKNLSQELEGKDRPRSGSVPERRPAKDW
jgi:Ca-activated chloride channel family protein